MRLGLILGFLVGGFIASLLQAQTAEAPDDAALLSKPGTGGAGTESGDVMVALKAQLNVAKEAGKEAAAEREAEMLLEYERTVHRAKNDA